MIGYDPGGNGKHGVAHATVRNGRMVDVVTRTLPDVESVVAFVLESKPLGIGVDTLTCWATGKSGLRPADRWLRKRYPSQRRRVVPPNALYGSMSISGMVLLVEAREECRKVFITETHPKVLYYALKDKDYDYSGSKTRMNGDLVEMMGVDVVPGNSHEWDAAISILPVVRGLQGSWSLDLHARPTRSGERLIHPCGRTAYLWPEAPGCSAA